jgi:predicted nucleic acid-binding protein
MPTPLVVPDASVLLKWVLPSDDEPDADKALLLRDAILDGTVHALLPSLWFYEVGNTVARRFPAQAQSWLSSMQKFSIDEVPTSAAWLSKTLELTSLHDVMFYDAAYHSAAIVHRGVLITADGRYIERAADSGSIVALSEWLPPRMPSGLSKQ